jgi:ribosome recycling factor
MAKQNFKLYVPRETPKKRKGIHKKSKNKAEKRQKSMKRYRGQG